VLGGSVYGGNVFETVEFLGLGGAFARLLGVFGGSLCGAFAFWRSVFGGSVLGCSLFGGFVFAGSVFETIGLGTCHEMCSAKSMPSLAAPKCILQENPLHQLHCFSPKTTARVWSYLSELHQAPAIRLAGL